MSAIAVGTLLWAVLVDTVVGEVPRRVHPVAVLGRWIAAVDDQYPRPIIMGTGVLLAGTMGFTAVYAGVGLVAQQLPAPAAVILMGTALSTLLSLRMLTDVAGSVAEAIESDISRARTDVRALVGRDVSRAGPAELRSAVLESLAENLSDGFVSTVLAFSIGALVSPALGLAAAAVVKAVNTYDSMVGYEHRRFGTPSARLDDLLQWLPARVTAVLLAVTAGQVRLLFDQRLRATARRPASPNSGWPMATFAAVSGVRLHKRGAYRLDPPGATTAPAAACVRPAIGRIRRTAGLMVLLCGVILWV